MQAINNATIFDAIDVYQNRKDQQAYQMGQV